MIRRLASSWATKDRKYMNKYTILSICESKRKDQPHAKNYEEHSIRLVQSVRKNGGRCKDIPFVMWYADDAVPSRETIVRLQDLGCDFRVGKCNYTKHPVYNKITACQSRIYSEYVIWMDSDLFVLGDFMDILDTDKDVVVSPDQKSTHRWSNSSEDALWEEIYRVLGVDKPKDKIACHMDNKLGNFYFCSGLFMFKNGIGFSDMYRSCSADIMGLGGPFTQNFTQTGLGMAVHKGNYSYSLIPEKYHYFYALHDRKLQDDTVIVHYQDNRVTEVTDEEWNVI